MKILFHLHKYNQPRHACEVQGVAMRFEVVWLQQGVTLPKEAA